MAYRHLPSPDFHRLDCQHYGLREDEHDDEDDSLISGSGFIYDFFYIEKSSPDSDKVTVLLSIPAKGLPTLYLGT
jgi:hypothetical protein